jgi:iron complex outermembrane receptor protein
VRFLRLCLPLSFFAMAAPLQAQTDNNTLKAVTVTATRAHSTVEESPQKITLITREEIEQQLSISEDPGQVLSNLIPSYSPSRQKLSNAGETFRGRSPLFLIDGVPQSNPLRDSARDSYTIDLSMVERIEVIHGASAEHGLGATGGIINFVTKRADPGQINQHASVSVTADDDVDSDSLGHKLNYRIGGQQGDWDYLAAATRQERGVFYSGDDRLVGIAYPGELQNSTSHDLMGRLGYWIDDHQNVEFMVNRFELEGEGDYVPVPGDRDNGIATRSRKGTPDGEPGFNKVTTARLSYTHTDWLGSQVDAQLYSQRFRARFATTPFFPYEGPDGEKQLDQTRNESDKLGAKFTLSRDGLLDDHLKVTTGLDLLQDETRQMLIETGRTYVPETQFRNAAVFAQADFSLTETLTLQAGARHEQAKLNVDTYQAVDRSGPVMSDGVIVDGGSPEFDETLLNAGLVYQATSWAQLYTNYSEGFGMPDVGRVLRGIDQPGQDVDTLLQLRPIVTDNREVGSRFHWDRYGLEVSYYESRSDYGERLTEENGVWVGNREKTKIRGVEVSGDARLGSHLLKLTYSQAEGESDTDGDGSLDTELTGLNIAPDTLRLAWTARWNAKLSSLLQYNHYFARDAEDPTLDFDGHGLLDASLAYELPAGKLDLGIANLLDKDYFTYYSQAARASDEYYFKGRGRTVTLGYSLDF